MQTSEWRVLIVESRTGYVVSDAIPAGLPTFSRALCDPGTWGVSVHLDDPGNRHVDFRTFATSARYSWVVCYGSYAVQGGPVTSFAIDDGARTLSVGGAGIGAWFKRRVLLNPAGHTAIVDPSNDIHWDGEFKWEVMRRLMLYGIAEGGAVVEGSPAWLPITYPDAWPNQGPGKASRGSYYGYDLANVWDRMIQLSEQQNGPEFEFAPVLSPDGSRVMWDFRIGEPHLGDQDSAAVWDYGGALSRIDIDGDVSSATVTRAWVKGEGSDRGLRTGFEEDATLYADGHPRYDYVDAEHTSVTIQDTLEAYADRVLDSFRLPFETWNADVRIDGLSPTTSGVSLSPPLGQWSIGERPTFGIQGHLWIPDGSYRRRVIGYQNSTDFAVRLTLQEETLT